MSGKHYYVRVFYFTNSPGSSPIIDISESVYDIEDYSSIPEPIYYKNIKRHWTINEKSKPYPNLQIRSL